MSRMNKTMMSKMKNKSKGKSMSMSKKKKESKKQKHSSGKGINPMKMYYRRRPGKGNGYGKGRVRSPSKPSRRPTRPTHRPPYQAPTMSPVPGPIQDRNQEITTDFSSATTGTPLLLFALAEEGTEVVVNLSLPKNNRMKELYIVRDEDVLPGSFCPPTGGSLIFINRRRTTVSISLDGKSSIVALCIDKIVVAQSYYVFEAPAIIGEGDEVSVYLYQTSLIDHVFSFFGTNISSTPFPGNTSVPRFLCGVN